MPLHKRSLRHRLLLLAAAGIVPLAAMSGFGLLQLAQAQREQVDRAGIELARALSTAVDAELRRSTAVLQALASSELLDGGDVAGFARRAARLTGPASDWQAILLADPSGNQLMNSERDFASTVGQPVEPQSFARVVSTRRPAIGAVTKGPGGAWAVPVRVPVVRDDQLRYVLTGAIKPDVIQRLVQRQSAPPQWVISVADAQGRRVARSRRHLEFMGLPATDTLQQLLREGGREGSGISSVVEGEPVYTAYAHARESGWLVVIGVPLSVLDASVHSSLMAYAAGIALSLLLGLIAALAAARSISRPIAQLRTAALALGRGESPQLPASPVVELQEVSDALLASARQRAESEAEREALLAGERAAGAAAEQARRRLELLVKAGTRLSGSLEAQDALQTVAHSVVPGIADWCRIDLLDTDGALQPALTYHSDPGKASRIGELARDWQARLDRPGSMAWCVTTGSSHLLDAANAPPSADPCLRELVEDIGLRAWFVVPLIAHGRTLGALATAQAESGRDFGADDLAFITELAQRAASALDNARLYAEAGAAREQAEAANRAKDEFLAMLGHELRNPLAPIVTALHLLERRRDPATARERGIIERQVSHLSRLVDDLLDVSRITRGKVALQQERVDMNGVVQRALELTQPALSGRTRPIDLHLPERPLFVQGDAVRLVQVLCNLLTNAAKFTPPDEAIALQLARVDGAVELVVHDHGSGISPDLLPRVFDLFAQGGQPMDRSAGGLGLGLAIVRTLVQMHRGSVHVASGGAVRGSRFTVRLPEAPLVAAWPWAEPVAAGDAARRGRILVVDDNRDAADTLAMLLEDLGYEVRTANDGPQALAALDDFVPSLALLDIGLPGMDGYELAQRLRADARSAGVRLVALTGYGREPDRARSRAAKFDEHLVKPVGIDRLLAVLDELLDPVR